MSPTGSASTLNGTRSSEPCVARTAAPSLSDRPHFVAATSFERPASSGRGSKATRAPASFGRPAKRLSNVARA